MFNGDRKFFNWPSPSVWRISSKLPCLVLFLVAAVLAMIVCFTQISAHKWSSLGLPGQATWLSTHTSFSWNNGQNDIANIGAAERWRPQVKTAYLISCHDVSTAKGAEMLVTDLYHEDHLFVIHFDRKLDSSVVDDFRAKYADRKNMIFLHQYYVSWGSYEVLRMMIAMLRAAYESNHPADAFINLCGHTIPLKSNRKIDQFLGQGILKGNSIMFVPELHACHKHYEPKHICNRTKAYCADEECTYMKGTPGGKFWYKGSQWWVLTREFVRFVLTDPISDEWMEFWGRPGVEIPDEGFFQTVFMHSPYRSKLQNGVAIYVDWREKCLSDENQRPQQSPCYLGPCDLVLLTQTEKPFARKVTETNLIRDVIRKLRKVEEYE